MRVIWDIWVGGKEQKQYSVEVIDYEKLKKDAKAKKQSKELKNWATFSPPENAEKVQARVFPKLDSKKDKWGTAVKGSYSLKDHPIPSDFDDYLKETISSYKSIKIDPITPTKVIVDFTGKWNSKGKPLYNIDSSTGLLKSKDNSNKTSSTTDYTTGYRTLWQYTTALSPVESDWTTGSDEGEPSVTQTVKIDIPDGATYMRFATVAVSRERNLFARENVPYWKAQVPKDSKQQPIWILFNVVTGQMGGKVMSNTSKSCTNFETAFTPLETQGWTAKYTWNFNDSDSHLDHYEVEWEYYNGSWITGGTEQVATTYINISLPDPNNFTKIRARVKPVSKTNASGARYFDGTFSNKVEFRKEDARIYAPGGISVESDENDTIVITVPAASPEWIDIDKADITFAKDSAGESNEILAIAYKQADKSFRTNKVSLDPGSTYRFRARYGRPYIHPTTKERVYQYSIPSDYSELYRTRPLPPGDFISLSQGSTSDSAVIKWNPSPTNIHHYKLQYVQDDPNYYIESPDKIVDVSAEYTTTTAIVTGLDPGHIYYFRCKAVLGTLDDSKESAWNVTEPSKMTPLVLGKKPDPPTIWSLSTTGWVGDDVTLYWVHNSADSSNQKAAQLQLTLNGEVLDVIDIPDEELIVEDNTDKTCTHIIDDSLITEDSVLLWKMRTKGVHPDWSEWSTEKRIDIYQRPTVEFSETIPEIVTSFPIDVSIDILPLNQNPIRIFYSVIANNGYDVTNIAGKTVHINEGTEISNFFVEGEQGVHSYEQYLTPTLVDLYSGNDYTISVTVITDSGLTAVTSAQFTAELDGIQNFETSIDLEYDDENYTMDIEAICYSNVDSPLLDSDSEEILDSNGNTIYDTSEHLYENATISIYRIETDNSFTPIALNIAAPGGIVTDPHPSLNIARYRVVTEDSVNGIIVTDDSDDYEVNDPVVILQWDEGKTLRLMYNIDVSNTHDKDVSLVNYFGRKAPVSYYGTQLGIKESISLEVPYDDEETLSAIRELSNYMGDVYIREPSGFGCWANISVSYSTKHLDLTVPITLDITKVEGGV